MSRQQGQRSNQSHTMMLHTYTPNYVPIARGKFLPPPAHSDDMNENNIRTALEGCGVKIFLSLMCASLLLSLKVTHSSVFWIWKVCKV